VTDGLDFLQVKNGLMISYLVDLTMLLRSRLNNANASRQRSRDHTDDDSSSSEEDQKVHQFQQQQEQECLDRLLEMKTALEKIRPLEKRMRYQIDKLLALSTLGAGMFAAVGREQEEVENNEKERENVDDDADDVYEGKNQLKSDPLSFKPDLQGMMKMFEGDDNEETNDNDSHIDSDVSDEGEISSKPKVSLEKDDNTSNNVYQPPRLQSVPFELDNEKQALKEQRMLEKQRDRHSRSELTQVIRSQFTDAPEEEDIRGGAMLGKQTDASRKIAARDADIREFEETQMIRLTMGKKEKKERKKMMRAELSNLGAISSGLGHVVAGVDDAFGGEGNISGRGMGGDRADMDSGSFKTKGMRKRKVDVLEHEGDSNRRRSKKKGGSNTYQKSLYGGGSGGGRAGGSGKSRKKK